MAPCGGGSFGASFWAVSPVCCLWGYTDLSHPSAALRMDTRSPGAHCSGVGGGCGPSAWTDVALRWHSGVLLAGEGLGARGLCAPPAGWTPRFRDQRCRSHWHTPGCKGEGRAEAHSTAYVHLMGP